MDEMTLRTLKEDGYKAVFIGIGKNSSFLMCFVILKLNDCLGINWGLYLC